MNSGKNKLSLNKFQKIELVKMLGLNTEENILIQSNSDEDMRRLTEFIFRHGLERVSIRTMAKDDSLKTLHFPVVSINETWDVVRDLVSKGLSAIVATCIDPARAVAAGVVWKRYNIYSGELAVGPHTVRRVTRLGIVDLSFEYDADSDDLIINKAKFIISVPVTQLVWSLLSECKKIPFTNCLIEISYYSIPVGWNEQNVIIWDIDSDGSVDSVQAIENYYLTVKGQEDPD